MKSPDEIKKGLECCHVNDEDLCDYEECPYAVDGFQTTRCDIEMAEDALALIQQLERQNRCLKENKESFEKRMIDLAQRMPSWISVEERLPKRYEHELVSTRFSDEGEQDVEIAYLALDRWRKPDGLLFGKVTHWMPLPLPPSSPDGESTSLEDGGSGTN